MQTITNFRLFSACVAFWLTTSAVAFGQTRVVGTVRDEINRPIQGASVTAENGTRSFTATTDSGGNFGFITLRPGNWIFTAKALGFTPAQLHRRVREIARNPEVNLFLARGAYGERFGALANVKSTELQEQLQQAEELYSAERYLEAVAAYEKLSVMVPALTTLKLKIGDSYLNIAQYAEAQKAYQGVLAAELDLDLSLNRELLYNFGETQLALEGAERAVGWYWRAHETDPAWSKPLLKLGEIALAAGDQSEGRRYLQMAIEAEPGSQEQFVATAMLKQLSQP
ncbi:MAG: carboxypeptidase regulatory-like domain-containing protein [Acidobacteriota bacterium]|nr:carboxypeptidase regulatory-like domain-containing protein [Acidobacteriota bacterium]MED5377020.1 carboxypeptidase regulatory-like domain-containing protein [Acidobacteriota bacterium]|tara:strand:- start:563 stop:1414 length:852 start_codon:yes stop_codon:yes gene_type:complete